MSMQLHALQCTLTEQKNTVDFVNPTLLPLCLQKPMSSLQGYFLVMMFSQRIKEVPGFFQMLAYEKLMKY